MNINPISSINFQARIKIQKKGFENLLKDVEGSAKIGARAVGSASSAGAELTTFPARVISQGEELSAVRYNVKAIKGESNAISARNLKTVESEVGELQNGELAKASAQASSATSLVGSGSGSYYSSGASALDQSVHYPNSLYAQSAYESLGDISGTKSAGVMEDAQQWAYNFLYDEHAPGNQSASIDSTNLSGTGMASHTLGSETIEAIAKELTNKKKIPS